MIEEFKDWIKGLKNILNERKKLEQEINESKNEIKGKLNMLDDEINNILGKLYVDLAILRLKCELFEKPYEYNSFKKERKLRILAKKKNKWKRKIKRRS